MIASRSGEARLARLVWRRTARRSMKVLTDFLATSAHGDPKARRRQIEEAVESLRHSPLRCPVVGVKERLTFRQLTVGGRFIVYYVYIPPRGMTSGGTISIRAIKHAASHNPFRDVREPSVSHHPLGVLTTRESTEPATA